jgi:malate synthase
MAELQGAQLDEMHAEWMAWQAVVREFRDRAIDVNASEWDSLIRAIEWWGEELSALRYSQTEQVADEALREKRQRYESTR